MKMAEENAGYVRDANILNLETEKLSVEEEYAIAKRGKIFGFVVTIIFISMGFYLLNSHNHIAGSIFSGVGFIPVLLAMFHKPKKTSRNLIR